VAARRAAAWWQGCWGMGKWQEVEGRGSVSVMLTSTGFQGTHTGASMQVLHTLAALAVAQVSKHQAHQVQAPILGPGRHPVCRDAWGQRSGTGAAPWFERKGGKFVF
jgi:hypothetical protein